MHFFVCTLTLNFDSGTCNTYSSHALFIEFNPEHVQTQQIFFKYARISEQVKFLKKIVVIYLKNTQIQFL